MTSQSIASGALAALGVGALVVAVVHERRMQSHRRPGVSYSDATFRLDGGWRKNDLFDEPGLRHQRQASTFGVIGTVLLIASIAAWVLLAPRG